MSLGLDSGDVDIIVLHDGRNLRTHGPARCAGRYCCIHNPSDHPLRYAPLMLRADRGIMERTCPHGVGHPDPDGLAYLASLCPEDIVAESVHACDGCC